MSKLNKNKNVDALKKRKVLEERKNLKQMLLDLTDQKIDKKGTDEELDRKNDIIKLLNGSEVSLKEIRLISRRLSKHATMYPLEYYSEIYRLNGWLDLDPKEYIKPKIIGRWTNELIYGRFPSQILPTLQTLNPIISNGIRLNKHFQWLNEEGKRMVATYIGDAISEMKKCTSWYEFRTNFCKKFSVPFQLDVFEKNDF